MKGLKTSVGYSVGYSFVLFCLIALISSDAVCNSDDDALTAYKEAKILFEEEAYNEAADKFREAYRLKPSWKILFNIGQCEAAAKNHGLALEAFEMFLSEGGDDILLDRKEQVIAEVNRLRNMVGYVKVTAPEGTEIYISEKLRGKAPAYMAFPVAAGRKHTIVGILNGEQLASYEFRVVGTQTLTIDLDGVGTSHSGDGEQAGEAGEAAGAAGTGDGNVQADESGPSDGGDQRTDGTGAVEGSGTDAVDAHSGEGAAMSKLKWIGWITTGVGVGTVVAAGVIGGLALKKNADLAEECDGYCPDRKDDVNDNEKMGNMSTAMFIGGGVVAATGIVLLILGTRKERQTSGVATVVPAITPDGLGAVVDWRF